MLPPDLAVFDTGTWADKGITSWVKYKAEIHRGWAIDTADTSS
jgi:hypothetical protein